MFELAERLIGIAPGEISRVDIALNGTEAVETAVRLMRPPPAGRSSSPSTAATTASPSQPRRWAPSSARSAAPTARSPAGVVHAPYPNPYRTPFRSRAPGAAATRPSTTSATSCSSTWSTPSLVAGVVIEPILGSGGCIAPPDAFWPALTALCAEHGWLLCADEVKTGFGRGGTMLAVERWGVEPDLICLGKAMGGGVMPIGAVLGTERVLGDVTTSPPAAPGRGCPARWRRPGDARRVRARGRARQRRARSRRVGRRGARRAGGAARADRRGPRDRLLPGDRVRPRPRDARARHRARRRRRRRGAAPRHPLRLEHDLAQPAAVAARCPRRSWRRRSRSSRDATDAVLAAGG